MSDSSELVEMGTVNIITAEIRKHVEIKDSSSH